MILLMGIGGEKGRGEFIRLPRRQDQPFKA